VALVRGEDVRVARRQVLECRPAPKHAAEAHMSAGLARRPPHGRRAALCRTWKGSVGPQCDRLDLRACLPTDEADALCGCLAMAASPWASCSSIM
jgi:hypothetical protein